MPIVEEGKCSDAMVEKDLWSVWTRSALGESRGWDCGLEAFYNMSALSIV